MQNSSAFSAKASDMGIYQWGKFIFLKNLTSHHEQHNSCIFLLGVIYQDARSFITCMFSFKGFHWLVFLIINKRREVIATWEPTFVVCFVHLKSQASLVVGAGVITTGWMWKLRLRDDKSFGRSCTASKWGKSGFEATFSGSFYQLPLHL